MPFSCGPTDEDFDEFCAEHDPFGELHPTAEEAATLEAMRTVANQKLASSVSRSGSHPNPMIRAFQEELRVLQEEVRRQAEQALYEWLGGICEDVRVEADTATIFVNVGNQTLTSVATANLQRSSLELFWSDRGIVPLVAKNEKDYLIPNVDHIPEYFGDLEETKSEVAIVVQAADGTVLGVVNLEFQTERSLIDLERVQQTVHRHLEPVALHLAILKALCEGGDDFVPWHPEIHGPNLQSVISRLCHRVARSLNQDQTHVILWYGDQRKDVAFVYATSGCGSCYKTSKTLSLTSTVLGRHLRNLKETCISYDPKDDGLVPSNLQHTVINGRLICFGRREASEHSMRGLAGLLVTFRGPADELVDYCRHLNAEEALPEMKRVLERGLGHFAALRTQIAETTLKLAIKASPRRPFESLLESSLRSVAAEGGSIFIRKRSSKGTQLRCVATTGLLLTGGKIDQEGRRASYHLTEDQQSWTVSVLRKAGQVVCVNLTSSRSEFRREGLNPRLSSRYREVLKSDEDDQQDDRRFLAVAVTYAGKPWGVIRLVRSRQQAPFTRCDEDVLAGIAKIAGEEVKRYCQGEKAMHSRDIYDTQVVRE